MNTDPPAVTPAPTLFRGCHRITAYQAGFEDTRYNHAYTNPYPPGTPDWWAYDQGNQDARSQAKREVMR